MDSWPVGRSNKVAELECAFCDDTDAGRTAVHGLRVSRVGRDIDSIARP